MLAVTWKISGSKKWKREGALEATVYSKRVPSLKQNSSQPASSCKMHNRTWQWFVTKPYASFASKQWRAGHTQNDIIAEWLCLASSEIPGGTRRQELGRLKTLNHFAQISSLQMFYAPSSNRLFVLVRCSLLWSFISVVSIEVEASTSVDVSSFQQPEAHTASLPILFISGPSS